MNKLVLELFSGSGQISETFRKYGWDAITIDYNPDLKSDVCMNVYDLTPDKIRCVW